jgi:hypothetical protein
MDDFHGVPHDPATNSPRANDKENEYCTFLRYLLCISLFCVLCTAVKYTTVTIEN